MTLSNSLTDTAATAKDLARALSTTAIACIRFIIVLSVLFYVLGASFRQFVDNLGAPTYTPTTASVLILPGQPPLLALPPAREVKAANDDVPTVDDAPDYSTWNVKQLRAEAKARKIKGYGNLTKNQLVAAIAA